MPKVMRITWSKRDPARGTMKCEGLGTFECLGKASYPYPADCTVGVADKGVDGSTPRDGQKPPYGAEGHSTWSREFNCWLPWAIRVDGTRGVYIHADVTSGRDDLSHRETHGCINLRSADAKAVYNWVDGPVRILITRE